MSVCRVSRRVDADPVIQELNVGDAEEPQGRGTGQPSLNSEQHTLVSSILKTVEPDVLHLCLRDIYREAAVR